MKPNKITERIAKMIELKDDATEFGGKSHSRETLFEFMADTNMGFGTGLETINNGLRLCGIMPITESDIPDNYEILLDMVLEKGGYILIPKEKRKPIRVKVLDESDGNGDYRNINLKSVVYVCESEYEILDKQEVGRWLKVIDTDDEMWDIMDYMEDNDIGKICEMVDKN